MGSGRLKSLCCKRCGVHIETLHPDRPQISREALNGVAKNMQRAGRGYSFEAIRAKMLYSTTLQKQANNKQARYGEGFGRHVPEPTLLGTDVDALLAVLEREAQASK